MNANTFYQNYGQYIARVQSRRECNSWPFVFMQQDNIELSDPDFQKTFMPYGMDYDCFISGVKYIEGKITYVLLPYRHYPVISFEFSGCWMAKLCFRGVWFAFHISTSETQSYDCKLQWKDFLSRYKSDISALVMFKPTMRKELFDTFIKLRYYEKKQVTLTGLIDEHDICYTLVYNYMLAQVEGNYIQQCPPYLLCDKQDLSYYSELSSIYQLWEDSGAEKRTARRLCRI